MILKLLANIVGAEQVTWLEVITALSLSVVVYFFLVIVLSI